MSVRRTLPQRARSLIGSWCFLDHFGPDDVSETGGMVVPRHPHTGLATVTWLFTGEVAHLDSTGFEVVVRPGQLNLMVAGRGVSHQEFSTPETTVLHGAQLWFALPDATRHREPTVAHFVPDPVAVGDAEVRVFLGALAGVASPVETFTPPLLGAEVLVPAGGEVVLELDPTFEHGVLLDTGAVSVDGEELLVGHLAYRSAGATTVTLRASAPSRLLLIGGVPLGEPIVMWWNFIGRSHEEVEVFRATWQDEISGEIVAGRFGPYAAGQPAPLPAPALPHVRLRPRE